MAEFYAESDYVLDRACAAAAFTVLLSDPRLGRVWLIEQAAAAVGYVVVTFVYGRSMAGSRRSSTTASSARRSVIPVSAPRPWRPARDACAIHGVRAMAVEVAGDNESALAVYRRTGFAMTDRKLMVLALAAPTHEQ